MGRRALRRIDPTLDLSRHLKTIDELSVPWTAAAHFDRVAPLEIDVGSGKGLFLKSAAGACPDRDFLGVEMSRKYARFAAARLATSGIGNAAVIHGDAQRLFNEVVDSDSLIAVHVYFPDPWWKERHKKRRIMTERFVKNVQRCLQRGGRLHFRTDVREYFESSLETIATCTSLSHVPAPGKGEPLEDLDYRTHFERRMQLNGQRVFESTFLKTAMPG